MDRGYPLLIKGVQVRIDGIDVDLQGGGNVGSGHPLVMEENQ
jgi:hypothetical protein